MLQDHVDVSVDILPVSEISASCVKQESWCGSPPTAVYQRQ